MVKFTTSDKQEFVIDKQVASLSVLIKNLLDDIGDDQDTPIPLPNVTGHILQKVMEYCKHHKDDPAQVQEDEMKAKTSEEIIEWYIIT
jgi:S-phase kinase-associated protein 1